MSKLNDLKWGYGIIIGIGSAISTIQTENKAATLSIAAMLVIYLVWAIRTRRVAEFMGGKLWLAMHGEVHDVVDVQRQGGLLVAKSVDGKSYSQPCSYCTTGQIDRFVDDYRLTKR